MLLAGQARATAATLGTTSLPDDGASAETLLAAAVEAVDEVRSVR